MKIKKAIIPAAGFGTRVLPLTKCLPKEMIPIVDKPSIQYIVEEAVRSGIEDILIVISRGKYLIEDHFDYNPELEEKLISSNKIDLYKKVRDISNLANIYFIRQKEAKGLGDAVLLGKEFIGDESFAVLYGDDVIVGENPTCKQLCDAHIKYGKSVVGIKQVSQKDIYKYSSMKLSKKEGNIFDISDMIEKPKTGEEFSLYSILGRCVLTPKIFDILEKTNKGSGGEIQLTDAMKVVCLEEGIIGVDFIGERYDMGNKFGILKASIDVGLSHPETKNELKDYIKYLSNII